MMAQETTAGLAKQSILHQTTVPLSECQTGILFGAGRRTYKTDHSHSIFNGQFKSLSHVRFRFSGSIFHRKIDRQSHLIPLNSFQHLSTSIGVDRPLDTDHRSSCIEVYQFQRH